MKRKTCQANSPPCHWDDDEGRCYSPARQRTLRDGRRKNKQNILDILRKYANEIRNQGQDFLKLDPSDKDEVDRYFAYILRRFDERKEEVTRAWYETI